MKTAIIGSGNVAFHLIKALGKKSEAIEVNPRSFVGLPLDADAYLICVSDDAIKDVAHRLHNTLGEKSDTAFVAHTSGSTPISVLSAIFPECGVVYPMQTFSKTDILDYSTIPFFIEGNSETATSRFIEMAYIMSDNIREADSETRQRLHLGAVFACNFTNRMYDIADTLLRNNGMTIEVLIPLIEKCVDKIKTMTPHLAQTGPAVRRDMTTISAHRMLLEKNPDFLEVYNIMTKSIINEYNE